MAKSVISLIAVVTFSLLPALLSGCGEKEISNGESIEIPLRGIKVEFPVSTVKIPLPFDPSGEQNPSGLREALLSNFQRIGYDTAIEENPYGFVDMTNRVMHRVGDSKGRVTINATKHTSSDLKVRNDTVRVDMIGEAIISVSLHSEIAIEKDPDTSDQQAPSVMGNEISLLQTAGQGAGADFDAEEVNHWLALFNLGSVSKDDKNKKIKRCVSRYGATINDKDCFGDIALEVDSSPGKLSVSYKDSAAESAINETVMPKLKDAYIEKFGQSDPKEKKV